MISYLDARLAAFADRLNPMLVRCVRQDLRSKVFLAVFSLLLLWSGACAIITASLAAAAGDAERTYGKMLFYLLAWSWSFALIVIQSSTTYRMVAQERQDDTWDLVELTGLPPNRVVRGLLAASLTQSVLYTSAMTPFLVMAYLLRGLDLLTIFAALVTVPMLGVVAAVVALFFACAAPNRKTPTAGGLFVLILMLFMWGFTSGLQFNSWNNGVVWQLNRTLDGDLRAGVGLGMYLNAWLAMVGLGLVFATTLLSHRASDRSTRPRRAVGFVWLNLLAWIALAAWAFTLNASDFSELLLAVGIVGAFITVLVGFFACTEDYALTPRQARAISDARGWRRTLSIFTGPGGARGRWYTLAFALSTGAILGVGYAPDDQHVKALSFGWLVLGYGWFLVLVGDWLARGPAGRWCTQPLHRRLVIIGLLTSLSVVPALAAMVVTEQSLLYEALILLSPGWAVYYFSQESATFRFDVFLYALPLIAAGWAILQAVHHRSLTTRRVLADVTDHNPRG